MLLDVYRTVLTVDFAAAHRRLAEAADVDHDRLSDALRPSANDLTVGRMTLADALELALRDCGTPRAAAEVAELVRVDGEALCAAAVVYDDVVPFLASLRERGITSAFVSNCAENTALVLDRFGLTPLVDAVVLSCDVGCAKPSAAIFEVATSRLGVEPAHALLVDDQAEYCDGAMAFGIRAVQLVRPDVTAVSQARITDTVGSLAEIAL